MELERVDCKANLEPKWPQVFKLQRNYPPTLPGQGLQHGARLLHPHYVFIETIYVPYGHSPCNPRSLPIHFLHKSRQCMHVPILLCFIFLLTNAAKDLMNVCWYSRGLYPNNNRLANHQTQLSQKMQADGCQGYKCHTCACATNPLAVLARQRRLSLYIATRTRCGKSCLPHFD